MIIIILALIGVITWTIIAVTNKSNSTSSKSLTGQRGIEYEDDEGCSKTCGGGVRIRDVWCETPSGERLDDMWCDNIGPKPAETEVCNTQPCEYTYTQWTPQCPDCGVDVKQTREVICEGDSCEGEMEPLERICSVPACEWTNLEWGECSEPCGGVQTRSPVCPSGEGQCGEMPSTTRECNIGVCDLSDNPPVIALTVYDYPNTNMNVNIRWYHENNLLEEVDIPTTVNDFWINKKKYDIRAITGYDNPNIPDFIKVANFTSNQVVFSIQTGEGESQTNSTLQYQMEDIIHFRA